MDIKGISTVPASIFQNQSKTDNRKTVADQNNSSRQQDDLQNYQVNNKNAVNHPIKLSITSANTNQNDNPLINMSLEESRAYLENLIKNKEIKKAEKDFSELAKNDWLKAAAIIEDRTNGTVTNLNKDNTVELVMAMYSNKHGNLADKIFKYLGPSQSKTPDREEVTPDNKDLISRSNMNENIYIEPENIIKLSIDSINGYRGDNPLEDMTIEEARTYLKSLVDADQQQIATEQFVTLTDTNIQKAADIIETFNADGTETHIDIITGKKILGAMAQNNLETMIDSIYEILGPFNTSTGIYSLNTSLNTIPNTIIDDIGRYLLIWYQDTRSYRNIVWATVYGFGDMLEHVSTSFKNDKDIVLAAVNSGFNALAWASSSLQNDEEVVLTALNRTSSAIDYVGQTLRNDKTFQEKVIDLRINAYERLITVMGVPPASIGTAAYYQSTKDVLNLLGIEFYSRFVNTREIIKNRYPVSAPAKKTEIENILGSNYFAGVDQDNRPIAVLVFPEWDWNGALDSIDDMRQLTKAYTVIYYDVGSDTEFANSVKEATTDNDQKADLLIIGGHGNWQSIAFDVDLGEQGLLDMTDSDLADIVKCAMADNGHVIEESCSNGEFPNGSTSGIDNISEFIHYTLFPNAYSHAAQELLYGFNLVINNDALFSYVTFNGLAGLVLPPEPDVSCDNIFFVEPGVEPKKDQKILSRLSQNYPNPFSDQTTISFEVQGDKKEVVLKIYNGTGQLVRKTKITNVSKGENTFIWNRANDSNAEVAPGLYICTMELDGQPAGTIKMIVKQ